MKNESVQLVKEGATATGTVSVGVLTFLQIIPAILGCIATLLGIILTSILIKKATEDRKYKRMMHEAMLEDIKYRREHNLPVKKYD